MALYRSLTDRLNNQHEAVAHIIAPLDAERVGRRPAPDKWSIHENIAHLASYQPVFIKRINAIIHEDEPRFERYRADDDPAFTEWRLRTTAVLLENLNNDRRRIFNLITSLGEADLACVGVHAKYGRLTIGQWVEFFLLHEAHHIFTIFMLANDVGL